MRRMIRGTLLLSLFLLGACSRQSQPIAPEKIQVTVAHWGHEKILIYLPLYVAMDAGLFDQQGLQVKIKYSGNDDQVFATVISGDAQFGVGDPTFTAISREKGGPGKVVATLVGAVANWGVTNKKTVGPIHDPRQLDGLRVTSFPSPSTTYTILSEIKSTLNLRRMKIVQLAFGTEIGALERGDADLAIMLEPQTSIAVSKGYREVWSLADYYGPFTLTGLTTSDDEIAKHSDVVQKMVNGLQQALVYIRNHPTETTEIASRNFSNLDRAVVRDAVERMVRDKTIPVDAQISTDAWRKTLEIRHKVGDLKSVEAGLGAVDNQFAARAVTDSRTPGPQATAGAQPVGQRESDHRPFWIATTTKHFLSSQASDWTWRGTIAFISDACTLVLGALALDWLFFYRHVKPRIDLRLRKAAEDLFDLSQEHATKLLEYEWVRERFSRRETDRSAQAIAYILAQLEKLKFITRVTDKETKELTHIKLLGIGQPRLKKYIIAAAAEGGS